MIQPTRYTITLTVKTPDATLAERTRERDVARRNSHYLANLGNQLRERAEAAERERDAAKKLMRLSDAMHRSAEDELKEVTAERDALREALRAIQKPAGER